MKTVATKYGDCRFLEKDTFIGRSLYYYGEWSGEECEKIVSLGAGKRCLDIGANIGFMSMALINAGSTVWAFEPQPVLFELLGMNCLSASEKSGNDKYVCLPIALSSSKRTSTMPNIRYSYRGNYGGVSLDTRNEFGTISVACETLDSLGLEVDFIKLDVEGHELEVLKGGIETLEKTWPIIYMEDDRREKSYALRKWLSDLGYHFEEHRPPMYRENNFAGHKKNVWDLDYESWNVICSK